MGEVGLKREPHFVEIKDGPKTYYGGDQEWFDFTVGRLGGCGTVAAADIIAYMTKDSMDKETFIHLMNQIYRYVKPHKVPFLPKDKKPWKGFGWTLGVWPSVHLIWGIRRYAKTLGMVLRPVRISCRHSKEELVKYTEKGLSMDCPIAMLIGRNNRLDGSEVNRPDGKGWKQTHMSYHWVVITGMNKEDDGRVMLKAATWGGWTYFDLAGWVACPKWPQAMVYFVKM